jgi:steroid delta-isomerase-like uncharacterized protein
MAAPTSTEENRRIARRVPEEVATEGRLDLIDELYAEDAVEHDLLEDQHGREAIREGLERVFAAFPDLTATVEDDVAEGDTVAMRVTLRGTHEGELVGVEPTGREFEVGNQVFTRIEDGRIVERWVQPDLLGLMRQLGLVDPPVG